VGRRGLRGGKFFMGLRGRLTVGIYGFMKMIIGMGV